MLRVHHSGDWPSASVKGEWVAGGRVHRAELDEQIEQAWRRAVSQPGRKLFDGPMCRLESADLRDGRLHLRMSRTSYKIFYGTNLTHPQWAEEHGPAVMANPLGVSTALRTADGFLMMGRRNMAVAYYPGRVHPFAGALEPRDALDVFAAARRELFEELNLPADSLHDLRCAGLVEDLQLRQPELIFRVNTSRNRAQIERALDEGEHCAAWAIEARRSAVEAALEDQTLTPVARATLALWGRAAFAQDWFDSIAARLCNRSIG